MYYLDIYYLFTGYNEICHLLSSGCLDLDGSIKFIMYTPGRVAEWLARRTHDLLIAGSSPTGASNILGQDMNPVGAPQCLPSRGRQRVAPEVDLRERTLRSPPQCE